MEHHTKKKNEKGGAKMTGKYLDPKAAMSESQLLAYDKFWMSMTDQEGFLEARYEKGMKDGLAEGRAKEKMEIARNLKQLGLSVGEISKATGLSETEIVGLDS